MSKVDPAFLSLFIDSPIYCLDAPIAEQPANNVPVELLFEGKNQKGIVVLIDSEEKDFLSNENGKLLLKICGAVSLQLNDIALINRHRNPEIEADLNDLLNYETLISFGVSWQSAAVTQQDALYQPFKRNGKQMLKVHSLNELNKNVDAKRALWQELKQLFA